jgi:hypothetical protein
MDEERRRTYLLGNLNPVIEHAALLFSSTFLMAYSKAKLKSDENLHHMEYYPC